VVYDWQHYVPLVERKPGALRNGAAFADLPDSLQRLRQALIRRPGGDQVMARLHEWPPPERVDTTLAVAEAPIADAERYDRLREEVSHG
jgi:hypothetical protein